VGHPVADREWVTGQCWRCDDTDLPVLWLGPVQSQDYGHAPFYACEPCARRLEALVLAYNSRDHSADRSISL
jgi:hypothetical protein